MQVEVRRAKLADCDGIAEVEVASWRYAYRDVIRDAWLDRMSRSSIARKWARFLRRRAQRRLPDKLWVAAAEDRIVGYCQTSPAVRDKSLADFAGEVTMLYLLPRMMGRGLGRGLFEHALEDLAAQGYFWVVVWVLEKNRSGRRFYERLGLQPDGAARWDTVGGTCLRVVRYAKALNEVRLFAD